ncbi:MAG: UDP-N-acetylmuramate dehydrogenase, partial [Candidatus Paceibacterota bacterium]
MNIQENVDIKQYSSLRIGGQFRYFSIINKIEDLKETCNFAKEKNIPIFVLGGGSNIVFSDGVIDVLVLKIEIKGFEIVPVRPHESSGAGGSQNEDYTDIKIGAGENWDQIVSQTVDMGLSGLESLSAIPGTVGATPVQNVGAYGSEVKDTIVEVEVFDRTDNQIKILSNKDCKFEYRNSIFKNEARGRYIVTFVVYRLSKKEKPGIPDYLDVKKTFERKGNDNPTLQEIRNVILNIRRGKFPDPKISPNVGSFFKIPFVTSRIAEKIRNEYPDARLFPITENIVKVFPGWLVEKAGLKGKIVGKTGKISTHNMHALILVNNGEASFKDLVEARDEIIKTVKDKFGITLE